MSVDRQMISSELGFGSVVTRQYAPGYQGYLNIYTIPNTP